MTFIMNLQTPRSKMLLQFIYLSTLSLLTFDSAKILRTDWTIRIYDSLSLLYEQHLIIKLPNCISSVLYNVYASNLNSKVFAKIDQEKPLKLVLDQDGWLRGQIQDASMESKGLHYGFRLFLNEVQSCILYPWRYPYLCPVLSGKRSEGCHTRLIQGVQKWRRDRSQYYLGGVMWGGGGCGHQGLPPAMLTTFSSCALIPKGERTLPS